MDDQGNYVIIRQNDSYYLITNIRKKGVDLPERKYIGSEFRDEHIIENDKGEKFLIKISGVTRIDKYGNVILARVNVN